MPLATNEFNVGVSPRSRKSARKPSSDISNVVGAKVEVPLDQSFGGLGWRPAGEYIYHIAKKDIKSRTSTERRVMTQGLFEMAKPLSFNT